MRSNQIVPAVTSGCAVGILCLTSSCKSFTTELTANFDGGKEVICEQVENDIIPGKPGREHRLSFFKPGSGFPGKKYKEDYHPTESGSVGGLGDELPDDETLMAESSLSEETDDLAIGSQMEYQSESPPSGMVGNNDLSLKKLTPVTVETESPREKEKVEISKDHGPDIADEVKVVLSMVPDGEEVNKPEKGSKISIPTNHAAGPVKVDTPKKTVKAGTKVTIPKGAIKVTEDNVVRIIEANGEVIAVTGADGVVIVKGMCRKLILGGEKNRVQCDEAKVIDVVGDHNKLTVGSVGGGSISGNRNEINWRSSYGDDAPKFKSTGEANVIQRIKSDSKHR